MFNIRIASEDDIPVISSIAEKTWWPTYGSILSRDQIRFMLDTIYAYDHIREQMSQASQTYLILSSAEGAKAFAAFGQRPEEPNVHKLYKLYVLPSAQASGYGQALVGHIIRDLLHQDFHVLEVNVNRHNSARSFYERLGFKLVREEDVPIGPFWMNDFVLRLTF